MRLARRTQREAGSPSEAGQWTQAPFDLPNYAIHAVLLPTGKVLFWGYPPRSKWGNVGEAALWDPATGYGPNAFTEVAPPLVDPDGPEGPQSAGPAPIYCSGQSLMANGVVLVAGGNFTWPSSDTDDQYEADTGLDTVFTFDPWTETWRQQPSMSEGHWYPSQVLLGDGRTLILGGFNEEPPGGITSDDLEIFTPGVGDEVGSVSLSSSARVTGLYPHLFNLPNGNVLLAGPNAADSALIKRADDDFLIRDLRRASRDRIGGTAVLEPGGPSGSWNVTQLGGFSYEDAPPDYELLPATRGAERIDGRHASSGWSDVRSLQVRRAYHNTVLLPDRSMVTVGGGAGRTETNNHGLDPGRPQRQVELYSPRTDRWRLGPAQIEDRTYHSTALLLPDGRVWSAGDDLYPLTPEGGKSEIDTAEIYSPPYLFRGERPVIRTAPETIALGGRFRLSMHPGAPAARKAVLVAPGATTHAADMHQRLVSLRVEKQRKGQMRVKAPGTENIAPPGYYMLFALSSDGVPSVASWVRLDSRAGISAG